MSHVPVASLENTPTGGIIEDGRSRINSDTRSRKTGLSIYKVI
jgi:hypothetical protein